MAVTLVTDSPILTAINCADYGYAISVSIEMKCGADTIMHSPSMLEPAETKAVLIYAKVMIINGLCTDRITVGDKGKERKVMGHGVLIDIEDWIDAIDKKGVAA